MVDEFVGILEGFLGIKRTEMSFEELWAQIPPIEAGNKRLKEYLRCVSQPLTDDPDRLTG